MRPEGFSLICASSPAAAASAPAPDPTAADAIAAAPGPAPVSALGYVQTCAQRLKHVYMLRFSHSYPISPLPVSRYIVGMATGKVQFSLIRTIQLLLVPRPDADVQGEKCVPVLA